MKLILLYGPPAVGKLTIARELQKLTGYKNFHNHAVIDMIAEVFPYGHPSHRLLEHKIRREMVEEAAHAGIDLIVTGVIANVNKDLYQAMIDAYKKKGKEAYLVQLKAGQTTLESRVIHPSRDRKIHTSSDLEKFMKQYPESVEKFGDSKQLEIDTTNITPREAAERIRNYFNLL